MSVNATLEPSVALVCAQTHVRASFLFEITLHRPTDYFSLIFYQMSSFPEEIWRLAIKLQPCNHYSTVADLFVALTSPWKHDKCWHHKTRHVALGEAATKRLLVNQNVWSCVPQTSLGDRIKCLSVSLWVLVYVVRVIFRMWLKIRESAKSSNVKCLQAVSKSGGS